MIFVCVNGKILPSNEPQLKVDNRSFKWGDGIFETMKFNEGSIMLEDLHFERLFLGLKILQMEHRLQREEIVEKIRLLCTKNTCTARARIRLAVFRDEINGAGYSIEAIPLNEQVNQWNEKGFRLCLYPFARKSTDAFAALKSANYLPYLMASLYAQQNGFDDALVLNTQNLIADSSRANVFIFRKKEIFTPALHQGCVSGVMRRFLLDKFKLAGITVHQEEISETDLLEADEVFLTNAIHGIRWVAQFREKNFDSAKTKSLYQQFLADSI